MSGGRFSLQRADVSALDDAAYVLNVGSGLMLPPRKLLGTGGIAIDLSTPGVVVIDGAGTAPVDPGTYDPRIATPFGHTRIDNFDNSTIDPMWTRVDGAAAPSGECTWVENVNQFSGQPAGRSLLVSVKSTTARAGLHGLMALLSGAGGPVAIGDGFVSWLAFPVAALTNYHGIGIVLADSITYGSANVLFGSYWRQAAGSQDYTLTATWNGYSTQGSNTNTALGQQNGIYVRLARVAATTWRMDTSPDCVAWTTRNSYTWATTPTYVGLGQTNASAAVGHTAAIAFLDRVTGVT